MRLQYIHLNISMNRRLQWTITNHSALICCFHLTYFFRIMFPEIHIATVWSTDNELALWSIVIDRFNCKQPLFIIELNDMNTGLTIAMSNISMCIIGTIWLICSIECINIVVVVRREYFYNNRRSSISHTTHSLTGSIVVVHCRCNIRIVSCWCIQLNTRIMLNASGRHLNSSFIEVSTTTE